MQISDEKNKEELARAKFEKYGINWQESGTKSAGELMDLVEKNYPIIQDMYAKYDEPRQPNDKHSQALIYAKRSAGLIKNMRSEVTGQQVRGIIKNDKEVEKRMHNKGPNGFIYIYLLNVLCTYTIIYY